MRPRPYQEEAAQRVLMEWDQGRPSALVVWATGLGKTMLLSYIGKILRRQGECRRILVIAHRTELIQQAKDKWLQVDPDEYVGIYQGARREISANVISASVQSCYPDLYRRHPCPSCQAQPARNPFCPSCSLTDPDNKPCKVCQKVDPPSDECPSCKGEGGEEYLVRRGRLYELPLSEIDLVIIDEVHHASRESTYATIVNAIREENPKVKVLGVTATPFRTDRKGLGWLFDRSSHTISIKKGIDMGYLVPIRGVRVQLEVDLSQVRTSAYTGDFIEEDLGRAINTPEARAQVVKAWLKHAGPEVAGGMGRQTAAFCVTVDAARALADDFQKAGVKAGWICGDKKLWPDKERAAALKALARGDIQVMVNVGVLTEGWDDPLISCVLLVTPTKSQGKYIQAVGRGTRLLGPAVDGEDELNIRSSIANGKSDCLVIDCTGASDLGLASVADLSRDTPKGEIDSKLKDEEEPQQDDLIREEPETMKVTGFCSYEFDVFSGSIHWQRVNGTRLANLGSGRAVLIFEHHGAHSVMVAQFRQGVRYIATGVDEGEAMKVAEEYALEHGNPQYLRPSPSLNAKQASEKQRNYLKRLVVAHRHHVGSVSPLDPRKIRTLSMARANGWVCYLESRIAFAGNRVGDLR